MNVRVDTSRLSRKLAAARKTAMPRRAALQQQATAMVRIALAVKGKTGLIYDTGRWRAALAQAANDVGAGPFVPDPIREGRLNKVIIAKAVTQFRIAQARVNWYESHGPLTRSQQRQYAKVQRRLDTAKAYLERVGVGKSTIAIGLLGSGAESVKTYDKVYGGKGYFIQAADTTTVALHNLEPHASMVEWRYKPMRLASTTLKRLTGSRQVKAAYVKGVLKQAAKA